MGLPSVIDILKTFVLIPFAFYSVALWIILHFIRERKTLEHLKETSVQLFQYIAIGYSILFSVYWFLEKGGNSGYLLIQLSIWILFSQLLWIRLLRQNVILKFLAGISFLITYERFVILATTIHRDYMPDGERYFDWEILMGIGVHAFIFGVLVYGIQWTKGRFYN